MALSQQDRIVLSKKIISADQDLASNAINQSIVQKNIDSLQIEDNSNKNLLSIRASTILSYENEIAQIDGYPRTNITETDYLNSANRVAGNYFFPANPLIPLPSVPNGVWSKFTPFMLSGGIGLSYNQSPNPQLSSYEDALVSTIVSNIATLETFADINRVTGQICVVGTIPTPDHLDPYPAIQNAVANIVTAVNSLQTVLNNQLSALSSNPDADPARIIQNNLAISSINTTLSAIATWLSYPDFNPTSSSNCAAFNSSNPALLAPTKGYSGQLNPFKAVIQNRQSFAATRKNQISINLGTVVQDPSTGFFISTTGFYGERAGIINTRLNATTGSLFNLETAKNGKDALQQQAQSISNNKTTYQNYLNVSKIKTVTNGTAFVHVIDPTGFSVGQRVYLKSDTQDELSLVIQAITGNMIQLNNPIPPVYRPTESGRLYFDKT